MANKKLNLLTTGFLYVLGSFFSQGLRFITLPIFSRLMSPVDYGYIGSYEVWVSILTVLVGLQTSGTIANAYLDFGKDKINQYTSTVLTAAVVIFILMASIAFVGRRFLENLFELNRVILFMGLVQCFFSYCILMLNSRYRMQDRVFSFLFFSISSSTLSILSAMLMVYLVDENKYQYYIMGNVLSYSLIGTVTFIVIYTTGKKLYNRQMVQYALKLALPLVLHGLASVALGRVNQMILLKFIGPFEAGIYNFGNNFAYIVNGIYTAFNQAYIPWYYKKLYNNETEVVKYASTNYMGVFTMFVGCLILAMPEIIKLMSTKEYYDAMYIVPIVIIGMYINFLYTFNVNYEFYKKKTQFIAAGTMLTALCNIILSLLLIKQFSIIGAAVATVISSVLQLAFHFIIATRIIKQFELGLAVFIKNILIILIVTFVYYVTIENVFIRGGMICVLILIAVYRGKSIVKTIRG
ncbi:hypothetical protein D3Z38_08480 [Clostridiales bacterium]|nr:hypothetical protein [Clostridiales bacterium]